VFKRQLAFYTLNPFGKETSLLLHKTGRVLWQRDLSLCIDHSVPGKLCIFGQFFQAVANQSRLARQTGESRQAAIGDNPPFGDKGQSQKNGRTRVVF
jgi:hypothetical protein